METADVRMELTEAQMRQIVDETFKRADENNDGKIDFEEYKVCWRFDSIRDDDGDDDHH